MDIVFEALVKNSDNGAWFIELKDTFSGSVEICEDLKVFEQKIQDMGENYGGRIDEVKWLSDDNLSPENMQKVRVAMMEYHEKYKDQLSEEKTQETK
jgi:hypothetical protein